jgi:thiosulfate dehydrogenase
VRGSAGAVNGNAIQGARIYDNWMLVLDQPPPEGSHPLWASQETNTRTGASTWRCVECHGWDYKGAQGAYGVSSAHFTGFPGVIGVVGATEEDVLDWLNGANNPDHNFLALTNSTALLDLAAFLRTQQIDMDLLIDPYTGNALGDRTPGRELYISTCTRCHGSFGDSINFGNGVVPIYLADIASVDPWQTLHKIRFGTATYKRMPATEALGWSLTEVADVLTYIQTLRRGSPELDFVNTMSSGPVQIERQAQIEPIIWGAFAIFALVLGSWGWDSLRGTRWFAREKTGKSAKR